MKVVVVLGGSGRLGSEVASALSSELYTIVNISASKSDKLPAHVKQYALEISETETFLEILEKISLRFGKIYAILNFAGRSNRKNSPHISSQETLSSLANELRVLLNLAEIITKNRYIFNKEFRLIDIGSLWAENTPRSSIYLDLGNEPDLSVLLAKSSKKRVIEHIASRYSELGVLANQVTPGWFPRPTSNPRMDYIEGVQALIPLSRIGQPAEILPAIEFLLNEKNSYTNGHELVVDGGFRVY